MKTLIWFQRDLRIQNNPCLEWALKLNQPIDAIYIHSPDEDSPWSEGAASKWWLHHSLQKLSKQLGQLNIQLHFFNANSSETLKTLFESGEYNEIVWGNRIEPFRKQYENRIEQYAHECNIQVKRFNHDLIKNYDSFLNKQNSPYKVFTPFYRKLRFELNITPAKNIAVRPAINNKPHTLKGSCTLEELKLLDKNNWHKKLHRYCSPGENSALKQLDHFIETKLDKYSDHRDYPSIDGTSKLSPHLHFGEISPVQIVQQLMPLIISSNSKAHEEAEAFLRQLIWREFARYILWHFPHTIDQAMNQKFTTDFWLENKEALQAWQQGKTGIDLVDAGMSQLWETGIMHNRVRMLVASLLTKNLGVPWQQGAQWFWDTLVDADLANNSMGWQWVAGCGVDAAPYFRIFNPDTQAQKFDKHAAYRQQWLDPDKQARLPMIDLKASRIKALERYKLIKS